MQVVKLIHFIKKGPRSFLSKELIQEAPRRVSEVLVSHYGDVIMSAIASQITSPTIVYSTVYSDTE